MHGRNPQVCVRGATKPILDRQSSVSERRIDPSTMNSALDLSSEVEAGLHARRPIVALESTIIAHGMPWPQNLKTALAVEDEVRALGAIPATIAIIDGRLKAGLTRDEIDRVGRGGRDLAKVSRRDVEKARAAYDP